MMQDLASTWATCNQQSLEWLLARKDPRGFVDTKHNPLTGVDYTENDGLRGPHYTYGWIQGRALEALTLHGMAQKHLNPELSEALLARTKALYLRLSQMQREDGHIYFLYDETLTPQRHGDEGLTPQNRPSDVYTYSDCFAAKGLIAAASVFAPENLPDHFAYFARVITAIEDGRFQMDEKSSLSLEAAAAQPRDFGPRMIALGACRLFESIGAADKADFGPSFIAHILEHHYDANHKLLRNVPGGKEVNAGHSIELVGFALSSETLRGAAPIDQLCALLLGSFEAAFASYGLRLLVDPEANTTPNPRMPWWSLPETIRAAAWANALRPSPAHARVLHVAHHAFFTHFWRADHGFAYQTLDPSGKPIDFVPATPDLDPGYHTGLSLLAAQDALSYSSPDRPRT